MLIAIKIIDRSQKLNHIMHSLIYLPLAVLNNNNNNNRICIVQVCRMTSEALDGQLQSCYTARARP